MRCEKVPLLYRLEQQSKNVPYYWNYQQPSISASVLQPFVPVDFYCFNPKSSQVVSAIDSKFTVPHDVSATKVMSFDVTDR